MSPFNVCFLVVLTGCVRDKDTSAQEESDADTDTDPSGHFDSDADTDADTDADPGESQETAVVSCEALYKTTIDDGVYWLDPSGGDTADAFEAFCDFPSGHGTVLTFAAFEADTASRPVAWWDMETEDGGNLDDLIGDHDLVPHYSPTTGYAGVRGSAVWLDVDSKKQADHYISDHAFPSQLLGDSAKSLVVWAYLEDFVGNGDESTVFASFGSDDGKTLKECESSAFGLSSWESGAVIFVSCNDDYTPAIDDNASNARLTLKTWHHIASTYDGKTVTVYLDGVAVGSREKGLDTRGHEMDEFPYFTVGADSWWHAEVNYFGTGAIDEVRVYDYALSADQVAALMAIDEAL
jgi:hypothetical protein